MPELPGLPVFTRADARVLGWSDDQLDRALGTTLRGVRRGVLTAATADLGGRDRHVLEIQAARLAYGEDWHAARRSAAVLHGYPLLGRPPAVPQLLRERRTPAERSSSRHRRLAAFPEEERVEVRGVPAASGARVVVDVARAEGFRSALVLADGALRAGLDPEELRASLARQAGWPGVRRAAEVVAFADGRAESPLESLGRVGCRTQGLPVFEPQVEVWDGGVLVARLDGLWREQLLVFESDGMAKLTSGQDLRLLERHEWLKDLGFEIVRCSWDELWFRTAAWAARVRSRMAERRTVSLRPGVTLMSTRVRPAAPGEADTYRWAS